MHFDHPRARDERPEEWVPAEAAPFKEGSRARNTYSDSFEDDEDRNRRVVDIFSIHSGNIGMTCVGRFSMFWFILFMGFSSGMYDTKIC